MKCNRMDFNCVEARSIAKKTILSQSPKIDRDLLEDLVQDAIEKALIKIEFYNCSKGTFQGWMSTLTKNLFIDYTRKAKNIQYISLDISLLSHNDEDYGTIEELESCLRVAMNQLRIRDRQLIQHRHFDNLSLEEIGEILGIAEKSVPVYLMRARKDLKGNFVRLRKNLAA